MAANRESAGGVCSKRRHESPTMTMPVTCSDPAAKLGRSPVSSAFIQPTCQRYAAAGIVLLGLMAVIRVTQAGDRWLLISDSGACSGTEGLAPLLQVVNSTLETCLESCPYVERCRAVDYYTEIEQCILYDRACTNPFQHQHGASSYQMDWRLELDVWNQVYLHRTCEAAAFFFILLVIANSDAGEDEPPVQKRAAPKQLDALNVWRLLATIHITFTHHGPPSTFLFKHWGGTWIGFFFALSGVGATYSKLHKKRVEDQWPEPPKFWEGWYAEHPLCLIEQFWRRWSAVYPLYFFALVVAITATKWHGGHVDLHVAFVEFLLMQGYGPSNTLIQSCYNIPAWFCSSLVMLWVLEEFIFEAARMCWQAGRLCVALAWTIAFVWKMTWFYMNIDMGWTLGEENGIPDVHCYFCGVLLAFIISGQSQAAKSLSHIAASTATVLVVVTFTFVRDNPYVSSHARSGMLPVQCLLIYGFGMGHDPLARLFGMVPPYLSNLAFGMYILQAPLKNVFTSWRSVAYFVEMSQMWIFFCVLVLFAAVTHQFIQKPVGRMLNSVLA